MNSISPFVFRLLNFSILAYLLFRVMRKSMSAFFFARRMRIRKVMLESVVALKSARAKSARSRDVYDRLPEDIAARKGAIIKRAEAECALVRKDGGSRAEHMVEEARRLAAEERARAMRKVKDRLLDGAFVLAKSNITASLNAAVNAAYAERGLLDLKKACREI